MIYDKKERKPQIWLCGAHFINDIYQNRAGGCDLKTKMHWREFNYSVPMQYPKKGRAEKPHPWKSIR